MQAEAEKSNAPAEERAPNPKSRVRLRIRDWGGAAAGMVIGAVIGLLVEFGIESTGVLGPKFDTLIEDQAANFEQIRNKLDELSGVATPEMQQLLSDLDKLVSKQDELTQQANSQLSLLEQERVSFKGQQLDSSGMAASIDFWLQAGDSVNVASQQQALAVLRIFARSISVNVTGQKRNMVPGDAVDIAGDAQACRVILRKIDLNGQGAGFDIDCT